MRRYKRRLRDHHAQAREAFEVGERARDYVLAPLAEEGEEGPAVVAEMSTDLPNLTVSEAVMRMDLANAPVLLFRNRSHGELNIVYRRLDGNIGWIDPELDPTRRYVTARRDLAIGDGDCRSDNAAQCGRSAACDQ